MQFVGHPGQGLFLEGLEIRETGFQQWLAGIRANPTQLDGLFCLSSRGDGVSILPIVAVLPFRAVGGDAADATVGDWMAEEMCRSLSRSRLLAVISHLSAREFASIGIDIAAVRTKLKQIIVWLAAFAAVDQSLYSMLTSSTCAPAASSGRVNLRARSTGDAGG